MGGSLMGAAVRWWTAPLPLARIALLRVGLYAFALVDMTLFVNDVIPYGYAPEFYRPLFIGQLLHLPTPTETLVHVLQAVLIVSAVVAASGRLPRIAGWVAGLSYTWWVVISMSYGKVDHDHLAILIAMLVLPTVGRAPFRSTASTEAAGWALRCIQVATIATYFLSSIAKIRAHQWTFGWPNSAILAWAIMRRPNPVSTQLLQYPALLVVLQYISFTAELLSPVTLFLKRRALLLAALFWLGFHAMTFALLGIHFLPTVVCWLAFAPLERLLPFVHRLLRRGRPAAAPADEQHDDGELDERGDRVEQAGLDELQPRRQDDGAAAGVRGGEDRGPQQ
ncbi:HTTM domain-containing protein [Tenggerimyces flavus]|uniref:HTTM domain-containing protein n=1 Tax=Tenggerimyces flavus TaxID=1708749 RepID=A0ABV7YJC0_9ACTN|nr:hypothetical protein [Tenggerimyces flavus]